MVNEVEVRVLSAARDDGDRWATLVPRLRHGRTARASRRSVRVLELGLEHDTPYVVMEWVGATTLAAMVDATGPRSRQEAMELAHAVASALEARASPGTGSTAGSVPARCFWPAASRPKLDFTGPRSVSARPGPDAGHRARDLDQDPRRGRRASGRPLRPGRAVALAAHWPDRSNRLGSLAAARDAASLGRLVRELLATDPADRAGAREVAGPARRAA